MSKKTSKAPKAAKKSSEKKPVMRWSLGVFHSAKSGELIATYVRVDGTVAPMYAKTVKTKKALFHSKYVGVTYAEAREQLMRDAAKAGIKQPAKKVEKEEKKTDRPLMKKAA